MNWLEVFIATSQMGIEVVSGLLFSYGITGLMIEDNAEFQAFLENPNRQWDYIEEDLVKEKTNSQSGITFFVSDDVNGAETVSALKGSLLSLKETEKTLDLGSLKVTIKNIKESDWANNWKKYFKPLPIGEKILIKPSWEELKEPTNRHILEIDPGQIFGTGGHETTQGCMEFVEKYVKEKDKVLDIGCGSGILAIGSLLLGADFGTTVDIDPNATKIVAENMERNNIEASKYEVYVGNILEDKELISKFEGKTYDVVEANIVADVIISLCPLVPKFIKDNGIFICSGIISERESDVVAGLESADFEVLEITRKKDWVAIASRFKG